jgi:hypothetical protein
MIECMKTELNIPEFYINGHDFDSIKNDCQFHDRIVDFIEMNINKEYENKLLCYFVYEDGTIQYADLPKSSYKQSILKSLEFYTFHEKYERCSQIKNLLKKL